MTPQYRRSSFSFFLWKEGPYQYLFLIMGLLLQLLLLLVLLQLSSPVVEKFTFVDGLASSSSSSSSSIQQPTSPPQQKKKVVVIGGGWAGYSAADAISSSSSSSTKKKKEEYEDSTTSHNNNNNNALFDVTILEASPRGPGGLAAGWKSPKLNRTVEAGIHGFWRDYANVFAVLQRLGLDADEILTPYTPSVLVSSKGKVALAPVLGDGGSSSSSDKEEIDNTPSLSSFSSLMVQSPDALSERLSELLPPPLDLAFSTFDSDSRLSLPDRLSGIGLLGAWADFDQEDRESWERYDKISADNLFNNVASISPALYDELVSPLLHVLPMTPGYDCSAAAALSCFHVFALQSKGAFDVRWCRGSITERIFNPWTKQLQDRGVTFRGGAKVSSISQLESSDGSPRYKITLEGSSETIECDAVALAVGGTALKRLITACPPLASVPNSNDWTNFRAVTCLAVRLFFKPSSKLLSNTLQVGMKDSPVYVCGPAIIPELTETGFCLYDLERLQGESFAIEVDYFRADTLADLSDDEVVDLTLRAISHATNAPPIDSDDVIDVSVVRARNAVSHFCVNSLKASPDVKLGQGLYICGDYVDRAGHASWSTEKSVVTGIQVAEALCADFGAAPQVDVIPAPPDSAQLTTLRKFARSFRQAVPFDFLPEAPWKTLNRLFRV